MNCKRVEDHIVEWIRDQVKGAGVRHLVIGLSGGVDSSVAAVLAHSAVGADCLTGLIMPCESNPEDTEHARMFAEKFHIHNTKVDLSAVFDTFCPLFVSHTLTARGNLKARLRMCALYFYANAHNGLVVGTTNKTEMAIGYYTKYGDGGVDIEPIADLYKHEVYELARYLEIPKPIIFKKPSAGL